jgi:hypothetical protein
MCTERRFVCSVQEIFDRFDTDAKRLAGAVGPGAVSSPAVDLSSSCDTHVGAGLYWRHYPPPLERQHRAMPERSVLSPPAGAVLDRALMAAVSLNLAFGFAAVATPTLEAA